MSVKLIPIGNRWMKVVLVGFRGENLRWEKFDSVKEARIVAASWKRALGMV